jgi:hypothetical protein
MKSEKNFLNDEVMVMAAGVAWMLEQKTSTRLLISLARFFVMSQLSDRSASPSRKTRSRRLSIEHLFTDPLSFPGSFNRPSALHFATDGDNCENMNLKTQLK